MKLTDLGPVMFGFPDKERVPDGGYRLDLGTRGDGLVDAPITLPDAWAGPVVYRIFDWADALMYVGSTINLRSRISGHKQQPWRTEAAVVRWVRVPYSHHRTLEANLIAKLRPPHNIVYNPDFVHPNTARALRKAEEARARLASYAQDVAS